MLDVGALEDGAEALGGVDGGNHALGVKELLIHGGGVGCDLLLAGGLGILRIARAVRHRVPHPIDQHERDNHQHIGEKKPLEKTAFKIALGFHEDPSLQVGSAVHSSTSSCSQAA